MARPRKVVRCPGPLHARQPEDQKPEVARDSSGHLLKTCASSECRRWAMGSWAWAR